VSFSPLINQLIDAFCCLPGVGPKSAQRITFHLLERNRDGAITLAQNIEQAMSDVGHCDLCRTFCETTHCMICASPRRDPSVLCILESPADVLAIEQSGHFKGLYFVLMGHLSPIDGIGPEDIGINQLSQRLALGEIKEVILATNPTVEGEATAHFIAEIVKSKNIKASRIAHGVPLGGELEYLDAGTLMRAINGRLEI